MFQTESIKTWPHYSVIKRTTYLIHKWPPVVCVCALCNERNRDESRIAVDSSIYSNGIVPVWFSFISFASTTTLHQVTKTNSRMVYHSYAHQRSVHGELMTFYNNRSCNVSHVCVSCCMRRVLQQYCPVIQFSFAMGKSEEHKVVAFTIASSEHPKYCIRFDLRFYFIPFACGIRTQPPIP